MCGKIKQTKDRIDKAAVELISQLSFESGEISAELNDETTVIVEVRCTDVGYREIEITAVDIIRDDGVPCLFRIAEYIGKKLDRKAAMMNKDEYQDVENWAYQMNYESLTGRFAY